MLWGNGEIDLGNPVANHLLNQGLVAWWLPLSNNQGSSILFDLKQIANGVVYGGATWTAGRLPYTAAILSDANGEGVEVLAPAVLQLPWPVTWGCWYRRDGNPSDFTELAGVSHNNTDSAPYAAYVIQLSSDGSLRVTGNSAGINFNTDTGYDIISGVWYHLLVCQTGAATTAWVNGQQVFNDPTVRSDPTYGATATVHLANHTGISRTPSGAVTDLRIHAAAFDDAAAYSLYSESARGYPGALRRWSRKAWLFSVTSGGGPSSYNVTAADIPSTTDSISRIAILDRTNSDSSSVTSPITRLLTGVRTLTDSLSTSDNITRLFVGSRTLTDSLSIVDSITRLFTGSRVTSDSSTVSEAVSRVTTQPRTINDSSTTSDSITRVATLSRILADNSITVSDSISRTLSEVRTISDSVVVSQIVSRLFTGSRVATDTISTSDSITAIKGRVVTANDVVSTTDSLVKSLSAIRTIEDTVSVSEVILRLFVGTRTLTDSSSVSSIITGSSEQPVTVSRVIPFSIQFLYTYEIDIRWVNVHTKSISFNLVQSSSSDFK